MRELKFFGVNYPFKFLSFCYSLSQYHHAVCHIVIYEAARRKSEGVSRAGAQAQANESFP